MLYGNFLGTENTDLFFGFFFPFFPFPGFKGGKYKMHLMHRKRCCSYTRCMGL